VSQADENPLEIEVELALAEYMIKCDEGDVPDREEFLARHPEMRERLSELLTAADWIEQLAGPTQADVAAISAPKPNPLTDETLPLPNARRRPTDTNEATLPTSKIESLDFSVTEGSAQQRLRPLIDASQLRDASELSQPALPCRFGEYILERVLGRGGMGVVYFGRQIHLDRPVAIKMIRSGALASQEEVQRFYAEARSAAKLDHPNIVTVYQCGEHEGHHYFSMDYVAGTDLARLIQDAPLGCKIAARYVRDVARAIQYAHDHGILHRDLKPANVLVDKADNVHITDFGLAKSIGHETGLTATGAALGTPSYMSPEQAAGRVEDHNYGTDVYSLGAILFTIVAGQPPFKAASVVQTIMQVIHRPAPMARTVNSNIDANIETIIDRCLQKTPDRRYATAGALAADLDRYLLGKPIEARPLPAWRRAWHWLLGVPIFGAVLDHRVIEPTNAHRWVQRGLIASALLMIMAWTMFMVSSSNWQTNRLPKTLRIAAGAAGGGYERIANAICTSFSADHLCEATSLHTEGSLENIDKLLSRNVDLALLQANMVGSSAIAVVAPLYYEAVHLVVRKGSGINSIADLQGKHVLIGVEKSGAYSVSKLVLGRAALSLDEVLVSHGDWRQLATTTDIDAAFVVVQTGNAMMQKLLAGGTYHLLPIEDAMEFSLDQPTFHALPLTQSMYPGSDLPSGGVVTIATTAFLAARNDAPDVLVEKVLECLFLPETIKECGLLSAERAAHWQGLAWHPAAQRFFGTYRN
jgi:TRAP transporter TAXI family solute receptor